MLVVVNAVGRSGAASGGEPTAQGEQNRPPLGRPAPLLPNTLTQPEVRELDLRARLLAGQQEVLGLSVGGGVRITGWAEWREGGCEAPGGGRRRVARRSPPALPSPLPRAAAPPSPQASPPPPQYSPPITPTFRSRCATPSSWQCLTTSTILRNTAAACFSLSLLFWRLCVFVCVFVCVCLYVRIERRGADTRRPPPASPLPPKHQHTHSHTHTNTKKNAPEAARRDDRVEELAALAEVGHEVHGACVLVRRLAC